VTNQILDWASQRMFNLVHKNSLVYNACWEDPRLDRIALELGKEDTVLMITSAGCNALDYALDNPKRIFAVDMNPRQNALLDLKIAGIRTLEFEDFFRIFGEGRHPDFARLYFNLLRPQLSEPSRAIWDKHREYFQGADKSRSFYFRGTSGSYAKAISWYLDVTRVRKSVEKIFNVTDLNEQRELYFKHLKEQIWKPFIRWALRWDATLALVGVPRPQKKQVEKDCSGGIAQFMEDCVENVFTRLPLKDNYFWWLYFNGSYTRDRCPEYLKPANFQRLKSGLVDCIQTFTGSLTQFLAQNSKPISRFVLLDHMDWLADRKSPELIREWQMIFDRSSPNSRAIWRSGAKQVEFLAPITVNVRGRVRPLNELLQYQTQLSDRLHPLDRVHTYGSFYIANFSGAM
jgi:S-adenosylmethionine-diacylglycerol 3-amino-3-carboxypropyl transferase